ncbi:MAG: NADH:ubiquinone reductase (Na(+)-transporting) subunit B [Saprospiraceae bacterium]
MKKIAEFLESNMPAKDKPFLHTLYDGFFTFAFAPKSTTSNGVHVRDGMDLKRLMVHVVIALQLLYVFGTYNIGHQHFVALGEYTGFFEGLNLKLAYGLIKMIPLFVVANVVGLGIEFWYAAKKGHAIEEGYLVTGALIPLIMPPDLPMWILALSIVFAVIIGKEAFGGTGMNVFNIALLSRVFVFFAYPTTISGDQVWVAGFDELAAGAAPTYGMVEGFFNDWIFGPLSLPMFNTGSAIVDGYTGATPMGLAYEGGWSAVTEVYSSSQMLWGAIPGSVGESNKVFILVGLVMLLITGIASWRITFSVFAGAAITGMALNAWGATPFMEVAWYNHFLMGSLLFAAVYMATDPVTATQTKRGKYIYGFLIGAVGLIVRVLNPAYPEGWMLAILFMNAFAPLIDHYVVEGNMSRRMKRLKNRTATLPTLTEEELQSTAEAATV